MVKMKPRTLKRDVGLFWTVWALVLLELVYTLYWVGSDLVVRAFPATHELFPSELVDFVLMTPLWQEVLYLTGVILLVASFVLVSLRQRLVLAFYPVGMLLFSVDWIMAAAHGAEFLTVPGYVSLVYQAAVTSLLVMLYNRGRLR